jgi:hypothetical protein
MAFRYTNFATWQISIPEKYVVEFLPRKRRMQVRTLRHVIEANMRALVNGRFPESIVIYAHSRQEDAQAQAAVWQNDMERIPTVAICRDAATAFAQGEAESCEP